MIREVNDSSCVGIIEKMTTYSAMKPCVGLLLLSRQNPKEFLVIIHSVDLFNCFDNGNDSEIIAEHSKYAKDIARFISEN